MSQLLPTSFIDQDDDVLAQFINQYLQCRATNIYQLMTGTGIIIGLLITGVILIVWVTYFEYRMYKFGIVTAAKIISKPILIENKYSNDYEIKCAHKVVLTRDLMTSVMHKFTYYSLPKDIINICLEYVDDTFQIYYGPFIKTCITSYEYGKDKHMGDTIAMIYDPKYPNHVTFKTKQKDIFDKYCKFILLIIVLFVWSVAVLIVIFTCDKGDEWDEIADNVEQLMSVVSIAVGCVLIVPTIALLLLYCIYLRRWRFLGELQYDKEGHRKRIEIVEDTEPLLLSSVL